MAELFKLIGTFAAIVVVTVVGRSPDAHLAATPTSASFPSQHSTAAAFGVLPSAPTSAYTQVEIDYFLEIALGAEFSQSGGASKIRKWQGDVNIQYFG